MLVSSSSFPASGACQSDSYLIRLLVKYKKKKKREKEKKIVQSRGTRSWNMNMQISSSHVTILVNRIVINISIKYHFDDFSNIVEFNTIIRSKSRKKKNLFAINRVPRNVHVKIHG